MSFFPFGNSSSGSSNDQSSGFGAFLNGGNTASKSAFSNFFGGGNPDTVPSQTQSAFAFKKPKVPFNSFNGQEESNLAAPAFGSNQFNTRNRNKQVQGKQWGKGKRLTPSDAMSFDGNSTQGFNASFPQSTAFNTQAAHDSSFDQSQDPPSVSTAYNKFRGRGSNFRKREKNNDHESSSTEVVFSRGRGLRSGTTVADGFDRWQHDGQQNQSVDEPSSETQGFAQRGRGAATWKVKGQKGRGAITQRGRGRETISQRGRGTVTQRGRGKETISQRGRGTVTQRGRGRETISQRGGRGKPRRARGRGQGFDDQSFIPDLEDPNGDLEDNSDQNATKTNQFQRRRAKGAVSDQTSNGYSQNNITRKATVESKNQSLNDYYHDPDYVPTDEEEEDDDEPDSAKSQKGWHFTKQNTKALTSWNYKSRKGKKSTSRKADMSPHGKDSFIHDDDTKDEHQHGFTEGDQDEEMDQDQEVEQSNLNHDRNTQDISDDTKSKVTSKSGRVAIQSKLEPTKDIEKNDEHTALVGRCLSMCTQQELEMRSTIGDISQFESLDGDSHHADPSRTVKKYERAAAGQQIPPSNTVRPPIILKKTMDFLLNQVIAADSEASSIDIYVFVSDRTRAIRQDFTYQKPLPSSAIEVAIEVYERMTRYLIHAERDLYTEGEDAFVPRIHREQFTNCIVDLLGFYVSYRRAQSKSSSPIHSGRKNMCENEPEFMSYYLLSCMSTEQFPAKLTTLSSALLSSDPVQFALRVKAAHATHNYTRFWTLLSQGTYLQASLMQSFFQDVRRRALWTISDAYYRLNLTVLCEMLNLNNVDETIEFCIHHGFKSVTDQEVLFKLPRGQTSYSFDHEAAPFPLSRLYALDQRLDDISVADVVGGIGARFVAPWPHKTPTTSIQRSQAISTPLPQKSAIRTALSSASGTDSVHKHVSFVDRPSTTFSSMSATSSTLPDRLPISSPISAAKLPSSTLKQASATNSSVWAPEAPNVTKSLLSQDHSSSLATMPLASRTITEFTHAQTITSLAPSRPGKAVIPLSDTSERAKGRKGQGIVCLHQQFDVIEKKALRFALAHWRTQALLLQEQENSLFAIADRWLLSKWINKWKEYVYHEHYRQDIYKRATFFPRHIFLRKWRRIFLNVRYHKEQLRLIENKMASSYLGRFVSTPMGVTSAHERLKRLNSQFHVQYPSHSPLSQQPQQPTSNRVLPAVHTIADEDMSDTIDRMLISNVPYDDAELSDFDDHYAHQKLFHSISSRNRSQNKHCLTDNSIYHHDNQYPSQEYTSVCRSDEGDLNAVSIHHNASHLQPLIDDEYRNCINWAYNFHSNRPRKRRLI